MPKIFFAVFLSAAALLFTACSTNNVTVDNDIQKYFDSAGVKGTFGFYDNGQGHFTIYNLQRFRDSAYPPGGTFDVLQSLIALQTGLAANDTTELDRAVTSFQENIDSAKAKASRGDTTGYARSARITLKSIFDGRLGEIGTIVLSRLIGKDSLKKWVDSLRYGNKDITEYAGTEYPHGRLRITADEQLGLTKKLYFDQLPFFQRTQKLVKNLFHTEQNSNYTLMYKASLGENADGRKTGWIMGWVEENKHPYFFVLNMESIKREQDASVLGLQLVKNILGPMGFFAGKK